MSFCQDKGIGVVIGRPFNSGILASDLEQDALYDYRVAPREVLKRARRIREVCRRSDVPLKAAALQFVVAHPVVVSVIPGSSFPAHVEENAAMMQYPIPRAMWEELRQEHLIAENAPTP